MTLHNSLVDPERFGVDTDLALYAGVDPYPNFTWLVKYIFLNHYILSFPFSLIFNHLKRPFEK